MIARIGVFGLFAGAKMYSNPLLKSSQHVRGTWSERKVKPKFYR